MREGGARTHTHTHTHTHAQERDRGKDMGLCQQDFYNKYSKAFIELARDNYLRATPRCVGVCV